MLANRCSFPLRVFRDPRARALQPSWHVLSRRTLADPLPPRSGGMRRFSSTLHRTAFLVRSVPLTDAALHR
jgi:hypothetical protein